MSERGLGGNKKLVLESQKSIQTDFLLSEKLVERKYTDTECILKLGPNEVLSHIKPLMWNCLKYKR